MINLAAKTHEDEIGVWEEFWEVFTDPAHILAEAASELVWDVIVLLIIVKLWNRFYGRMKHNIHKEIDESHGITHD